MKSSHPRAIGAFEVRSMVLFASLAFGGVAGAQTVPQPAARSAAAPASPAPSGRTAAAPRKTVEQAAFERADVNHDGQLSADEAQALPVIASRLHELDADRNGSLSLEEFQRGARQ